MYMLTKAEKDVRIEPKYLGNLEDDFKSVIEQATWANYEGEVDSDKSITVLIRNIEPVGYGHIVHGDGSVFQTVRFEQLVFKPVNNELVEGTVEEITKFGAFVKFGPVDGLIHISQVMDDHVDANVETQTLTGKDSKRFLAKGDRVRARIVGLAINEKNVQDSRIALTMRQPGLGKISWIEEDENKTKGAEADA